MQKKDAGTHLSLERDLDLDRLLRFSFLSRSRSLSLCFLVHSTFMSYLLTIPSRSPKHPAQGTSGGPLPVVIAHLSCLCCSCCTFPARNCCLTAPTRQSWVRAQGAPLLGLLRHWKRGAPSIAAQHDGFGESRQKASHRDFVAQCGSCWWACPAARHCVINGTGLRR